MWIVCGYPTLCRVTTNWPEPVATYQYRSTSGGEPRLVERFTTPLLVAFERLMGLIHIRREMTPVSLPDGQQLQIDDFAELAVREALINGFMQPAPRLGRARPRRQSRGSNTRAGH